MIHVNASKDLKEFDFSGTSSDYKAFISSIRTKKAILKLNKSEFYPVVVEGIQIEKTLDSTERLTFLMEKSILKIKGGQEKINSFTRSLENISNSSKAGHYHIDYFGNSDLISQEDISIVLNIDLEV